MRILQLNMAISQLPAPTWTGIFQNSHEKRQFFFSHFYENIFSLRAWRPCIFIGRLINIDQSAILLHRYMHVIIPMCVYCWWCVQLLVCTGKMMRKFYPQNLSFSQKNENLRKKWSFWEKIPIFLENDRFFN